MKRTLKQIMSLPVNTPDPVVYVLSGILPMESQIHVKSMYNSNCLQNDSVVENQLAYRQLSVKDHTSSSWFTSVNRILLKYGIQSACTLLSKPVQKLQWKRLVNPY